LRSWPQVSCNDPPALKKFYRFLLSGLTYKRGGNLKELDSETVIRVYILSKFDKSVYQKWLSKFVKAKKLNTGQLGFPEVVKFIEHLSLLESEPSYSPLAYKNDACKTGTKSFEIRQKTTPNHPQICQLLGGFCATAFMIWSCAKTSKKCTTMNV